MMATKRHPKLVGLGSRFPFIPQGQKNSLIQLYNTRFGTRTSNHLIYLSVPPTISILPINLPKNPHVTTLSKLSKHLESTGKISINPSIHRSIHPSHFAFSADTARLRCSSIRILNRCVDCAFPSQLMPHADTARLHCSSIRIEKTCGLAYFSLGKPWSHHVKVMSSLTSTVSIVSSNR